MAILTDQTAIADVDVDGAIVLHTVDPKYTVDNPAGDSFKITLSQVSNFVQLGLYDDRGNYDASVNLYPATGGSGTAGAILKGDIWTVSVAGTIGGVYIPIGSTVRALIDTPAQTGANWAIDYANSYNKVTIKDANGIPTNYSTITAAMADIPVGGTIFINADITESVVIDKGMKIIGNGYALTGRLTHIGTVDVSVLDLIVTHEHVSETALEISASSNFNLLGSTFNNSLGTVINVGAGSSVIYGKTVGKSITNAGTVTFHNSSSSTVTPAIVNSGVLKHCIATNSSNGAGISQTAGEMWHCNSKANVGQGINASGGILNHCTGESGTSTGIITSSTAIAYHCKGTNTGAGGGMDIVEGYNCVGISATGIGLVLKIGANCSGKSGGLYGIQSFVSGSYWKSCTGESSAAVGASITVTTTMIDCYFKSTYNNANGHAVGDESGTSKYTGCTFETANALAYAISSSLAISAKLTDSKFNTTLGLHANVTNTELRVEDNQGNRFIN